jgi:hypothetical protein
MSYAAYASETNPSSCHVDGTPSNLQRICCISCQLPMTSCCNTRTTVGRCHAPSGWMSCANRTQSGMVHANHNTCLPHPTHPTHPTQPAVPHEHVDNQGPGHGVKLLGRLPCVQKVQVSILARRMVPFCGAMALSLSVLLSGLCPCGASVRGRGFGHFASTKCHPV